MTYPGRDLRALWIFLFFIIVMLSLALIGPRLGSKGFKFGHIQAEGTKVVAAVEAYRRDTGALPLSLEALVPRYLPQISEIEYARTRSYSWFYKLFDHDLKSRWVYKVSRDKSGFALAVEARTWWYYNSKSGEWVSDEGFSSF